MVESSRAAPDEPTGWQGWTSAVAHAPSSRTGFPAYRSRGGSATASRWRRSWTPSCGWSMDGPCASGLPDCSASADSSHYFADEPRGPVALVAELLAVLAAVA